MDLLSWFTSNDPVRAVDPADLRSMWAISLDCVVVVIGAILLCTAFFRPRRH